MGLTPLSLPVTTTRVIELLNGLNWNVARVADIGAGEGYFTQQLGEVLRARGLDPARHLAACDLMPELFRYSAIPCEPIAADGKLPFADGQFDAAVSVEVIEHVENQFAFFRELARIVKPGGIVVVTTPNTLNANSRLRVVMNGFPLLFDPLPLTRHDPRHLGGHIHPISPYFLAYAALRAGLSQLTFHPDRMKKSGAMWAVLLAPAFALGAWSQRRRLRRKWPDIAAENRTLLERIGSWDLLTCRTAVLRGVKL